MQDGKIVGAAIFATRICDKAKRRDITHAPIGDPTTGYGIFIENMPEAAQKPKSS